MNKSQDHSHEHGNNSELGHVHTHTHTHAHSHPQPPQGGRRLLGVIILTTTIFFAELIGGLLSGSLALLADAGHMLSDSVGLVIAGVAIVVGAKKMSARATFGYRRVEVLAAAINAVTILAIAVWIVVEAVRRLGSSESIDSWTMMLIAIIGLVANLISALILHQAADSSLNLKGAYLHVLVDLLGSVAVIIAAIVIRFTGWVWMDTVVSVFIATIIVPRAWQLLREAGSVLMEGVPTHIDLVEVQKAVEAIPGVDKVHDFHIWSVDGQGAIATLHVVSSHSSAPLLDSIQELLYEEFSISHSTVQIEEPGHENHEYHPCSRHE